MSTESLKPAASKEATSPTAATASQTEATSHRSFPWNDLWAVSYTHLTLPTKA